MKKYLMTGIAAIAMCAAFTSCSHDVDPVSQEDLNKMAAEKVVNNYNQAFIATFGQPAANQDWGFGTKVTRGSINVNGNMWDTCPTVETPDEVNAIFNYVNYTLEQMDQIKHKYSTRAPENLNGYFVTQVRNGKNSDNNYTNKYNNNAEVKEVGVYMNHLQIAFNQNPSLDDLNNATFQYPYGVSGWTHINNFNASDNANYGGNTKVENAGAYDFAYHNSFDSKYHNKWILIDGADITADGKYKDYLYVCFDFESTPQCTTRFRFNYNGQEYGPVDAAGAWTVADAIANHVKVNINGSQVDLANVTNLRIDNIIDGDKMVPGDNKYTDWIVRITKGQPSEPEWDIRVIAEDLNASATTDKVNSDWDFNDVVFDVKFLDTPVDGNNVKIRIVAAGGTYPLYVAGQEVHALFEQNTDVMINTNASAYGKHYETTELPIFYVYDANAKSTNGKSIAVTVDMGNGPIEMTAEVGKPAAKIGVSPNFNYCMERVDITTQYPLFNQWVTTATPATGWWNSTITGQ